MSAQVDAMREKLWDDLAEQCKLWRLEGIPPNYIAARLLLMSIAIAEHAGVSREQMVGIVNRYYEPAAPQVPYAKA